VPEAKMDDDAATSFVCFAAWRLAAASRSNVTAASTLSVLQEILRKPERHKNGKTHGRLNVPLLALDSFIFRVLAKFFDSYNSRGREGGRKGERERGR
jgi:hypothetical protein